MFPCELLVCMLTLLSCLLPLCTMEVSPCVSVCVHVCVRMCVCVFVSVCLSVSVNDLVEECCSVAKSSPIPWAAHVGVGDAENQNRH